MPDPTMIPIIMLAPSIRVSSLLSLGELSLSLLAALRSSLLFTLLDIAIIGTSSSGNFGGASEPMIRIGLVAKDQKNFDGKLLSENFN